MNRAGCTIVSPNYLPFARTLAASYVRQHPEQHFFVLIVADLTDPAPFGIDLSFTPVMLGQIGLRDLRVQAMQYDILELNTNVKPTFMKHLLQTHSLDALVYLDPDTFVYQPLDPVFAALDGGATAVLTPHITSPITDEKSPSEQDLLYNGTYNLGFMAVSRTEEARRLLDWWESRCLTLGFSEGRTGLFVDQKWINLAPGLFDRVVTCRDAGLNMAYWNLHERELVETPEGFAVRSAANGRVPLRFFHFSGADASVPTLLSKNTDRFTLASRPDLRRLFEEYTVILRGNEGAPAEALPYGFDKLSDGVTVTRLARRLFAAHAVHFTKPNGGSPDPFLASGSFARFARAQGLMRGHSSPAKATWREFNPYDRRVGAVHRLLRFMLRVLGPHRYELLMRYLAHISVLRHQGVFLRDRGWGDETASQAKKGANQP